MLDLIGFGKFLDIKGKRREEVKNIMGGFI